MILVVNIFLLKKKINLLESKIGLYNAGGSCYMASFIQILIYLLLFLDQFYKSYNCNTNSLYIKF